MIKTIKAAIKIVVIYGALLTIILGAWIGNLTQRDKMTFKAFVIGLMAAYVVVIGGFYYNDFIKFKH